jgi:hypothetical protein
MKGAAAWANGLLLRLDLTENCLEAGKPVEGGRKYDQIRMVIFKVAPKVKTIFCPQ